VKSRWLLLALLAVSCRSAERSVEFRIVSIDTEERAIPCVVILDNEMVRNGTTNQPIRTPAPLRVSFRKAKDASGDTERVELGVRALSLDPQGNVVGGVEPGSPSPFIEQKRFLRPEDGPTQVFILRRNKEFGG
jgi:hypothetical protein